MEDGSNALLSSDVQLFDLPRNGVSSPVMAKSPEGNVTVAPEDDSNSCGGEVIKSNEDTLTTTSLSDKVNDAPTLTKINGDNVSDSINNSSKLYDDNDSYDSESDALVIDLGATKKQKSSRKKKHDNKQIEEQKPKEESNSINKSALANDEVVTHSNPFFNESLFELSLLHQTSVDVDTPNFPLDPSTTNTGSASSNNNGELKKPQKRLNNNSNNKTKPKPKLKEYAQYLGLQPTVQFKCSKCGQSGFESLSTLHEHIVQCDSVLVNVPAQTETTTNASSTSVPTEENNACSGFKLTRKVFLCSSCGTYYENWNLYMHMLEFHRRYICLYCLGMFSMLEDLCQHIQSRHNLVPGHKSSLDEFFNVYNEPCYLVCCECNKLFSEQDNFFYHNCVSVAGNTSNNIKLSSGRNNKKTSKQQITPENHVTGESEETAAIIETEKDTSVDDSSIVNDKNDSAASSGDAMEKEVATKPLPRKSIDTRKVSVDEEFVGFERIPSLDDRSVNTIAVVKDKEEEEDITRQNHEAVAMETSENISNAPDDSDKLPLTNDKNVEDDKKCEVDNNEPVTEDKDQCSKSIEDTEAIDKSDSFDEALLNDDDDEEEDVDDNDDNEDFHRRSSDTEMKNEENNPPATSDNTMITTETRKVPKLSLKLPKLGSSFTPHQTDDSDDNDDDDADSDKLTLEVDRVESENDNNTTTTNHHQQLEPDQNVSNPDEPADEDEINVTEHDNTNENQQQQHQVAGAEVPIIELELEQPLDKFDARILLQKCLKTTIASCIYCNHARKIAVNGKQLALHCIAEHRFSAVVRSITAEELIPESFVNRFKESMEQLEDVFFNLESSFSQEAITFSHLFECFQCYFSTTVHKELYLHNRKYHSKNLLLCIMCKSNFFSYSELICHLCPGMYILDYELQFRCCMCVNDDLPSSFRLMVHLRKRHNVCDVCLEMCHTQYRLSNHVWKHKLNHFCYRCGIAYRNKPDITRHLFWKHGTESVLCKRCLQKKWPHMYHFCVPPVSFSCDECTQTFSRAVALKVHKRLHSEDGRKHLCTFEGCPERFISKKLMLKHEARHRDPQSGGGVGEAKEEDEEEEDPVKLEGGIKKEECDDLKKEIDHKNVDELQLQPKKDGDDPEGIDEKPTKPKMDVLDLPALNLSESDSSDSETEHQNSNNDVVTKTIDDEEQSQDSTPIIAPDMSSSTDENQTTTAMKAEEDEEREKREENKSLPGDEKLEEKTQSPLMQDDQNKETEDRTAANSNTGVVDDVDCQVQNMELENTTNVIQSIWDNFKNYQASKEKLLDNMFVDPMEKYSDPIVDIPVPMIEEEEVFTAEMALRDHDYCIDPEQKTDNSLVEAEPALSESVDHDYCSPNANTTTSGGGTVAEKPPIDLDPVCVPNEEFLYETKPSSPTTTKSPKREKKNTDDSSSSSSSDNDSSSCSCGTNCSCSSSSSSSSSSSDSSNSDSSTEEGRQKQLARRKKRKERAKKLKEKAKVKQENNNKVKEEMTSSVVVAAEEVKNESSAPAEAVAPLMPPLEHVEIVIRESDLETDESETDEEFYDRAPHKIAKKMQEEKRLQMLAISQANANDNNSSDAAATTTAVNSNVAAGSSPSMNIPNGTFFESTSRPPTPPAGSFTVEEEQAGEERKRKKSKSKKRKKRKSERRELDETSTTNNHHHHNHHQFANIIGDDVPIPPYYQQFHQQQLPQQIVTPTVAPLTLSLSRNSPIPQHHLTSSNSMTPTPTNHRGTSSSIKTPVNNINSHGGSSSIFGSRQESSATDSSLRASKRRRVPNKFYGYSSDEEEKEKSIMTTSPFNKWRKLDNPQTPKSPMIVPPITIKTTPQLLSPSISKQQQFTTPVAAASSRTPPSPPSSQQQVASSLATHPPPPPHLPPKQHLTVEPISIKTGTHLSDFRVRQRPRKRPKPKQQQQSQNQQQQQQRGFGFNVDDDSGSDDSNDSSSEDQASSSSTANRMMAAGNDVVKPAQPQLYCYCRCPYDEVSEMIGCDASDCAIEWFHFECVGIMVPPKGQWFCPDCRKKKQQRQMMLQQQQQHSN